MTQLAEWIESILTTLVRWGRRTAGRADVGQFVRSQVLYVRISPDWVSVRNVRTGQERGDVPEVVLSNGPGRRVMAVGIMAKPFSTGPLVTVVNPFLHPRSILGDYRVADLLLRQFMLEVVPTRYAMLPCVVVIHPKVDPEGGFTEIEVRALRELAMSIGAGTVIVWHGSDLEDAAVLSQVYPRTGLVLNSVSGYGGQASRFAS